MKTIKFILAILFSALLLVGCELKNGIDNNLSDKELISELRSMVTETLFIGSKSYVLEAYMWRDFQPISPENGKPLISINWLVCTDSVKIPANIHLVKQFVIYGDVVWVSDYSNETLSAEPEYKIKKVSREGPKWGPHVSVDVISQIHDSNTDKDYYVGLKNVYIDRTD